MVSILQAVRVGISYQKGRVWGKPLYSSSVLPFVSSIHMSGDPWCVTGGSIIVFMRSQYTGG